MNLEENKGHYQNKNFVTNLLVNINIQDEQKAN